MHHCEMLEQFPSFCLVVLINLKETTGVDIIRSCSMIYNPYVGLIGTVIALLATREAQGLSLTVVQHETLTSPMTKGSLLSSGSEGVVT